jgi:cell volume regulation protein A
MHGVLVRELRLPVGAVLSLLVRDGEGMVPGPDTRLRRGDQLLVVTTQPARAAAERRLRAVGRAGRLASWLEGGSEATRTRPDGSGVRRRREPGDSNGQ